MNCVDFDFLMMMVVMMMMVVVVVVEKENFEKSVERFEIDFEIN